MGEVNNYNPPTTTYMAGEGGSSLTKISYFVNGDAQEANPQDVMTGDANIGNNGTTTASSASAAAFFNGRERERERGKKKKERERESGTSGTTTTRSGVTTGKDTDVGDTTTAFNGSPWWSWTANDFHQKSGNLGMADGSCQGATISGLHQDPGQQHQLGQRRSVLLPSVIG